MGTEFFWFYDLLIVAIFLGITFRCYKKGFVSSVVSLTAVAGAFLIGLLLSGVIASAVYDNFIKERAEEYISESIEQIVDDSVFIALPTIDASMILIRGVPLHEINMTPDTVGNIDLDLTNVDLSQTGIENLNLEFFGIKPESLSSINAGRAVITPAELAKSDIETLVLAKILANTLQESSEYIIIESTAQLINDLLPQISKSLSGGVNDAVSEIIVAVIESEDNSITNTLLDNLITPVIMLPLRTLIFFIIFVIISIALSFAAKAFSFVNRIPLIGAVNSLLGIAVGILISALVIFLVCIFVKILITITGNTIIFLNTMTIEQSYVFKYIYNFNLLG